MLISITDKHFALLSLSCSFLPSALSPLRCACSSGADKHGRSDLSHAAHARRSAPSAVRLRPAVRRLLPDKFLCQTTASSTPQCLLQWNDWPSTPLLQPGETGKGLVFRASVPYLQHIFHVEKYLSIATRFLPPKWHSLIHNHIFKKALQHFCFCVSDLPYMIFI